MAFNLATLFAPQLLPFMKRKREPVSTPNIAPEMPLAPLDNRIVQPNLLPDGGIRAVPVEPRLTEPGEPMDALRQLFGAAEPPAPVMQQGGMPPVTLPTAQTPTGVPRRSDYLASVPGYKSAPIFIEPERDTKRENNQTLLGAGIAGILGSIFGRGNAGAQAMTGYATGAREAQDANYQRAYQNAGNVYKSQAGAVDDFNQNVQRQTTAAGAAFDDAYRAHEDGLRAKEREETRAAQEVQRKAAIANTHNDNRNALGTFLAKFAPDERRGYLDKLTGADLANMGATSPSDLYTIADGLNAMDAAKGKAAQEKAAAAQVKQAGTNRQSRMMRERDKIYAEIMSPRFNRSAYGAKAARFKEVDIALGGRGVAPALPAMFTPGETVSQGNADRNYGLGVARFGYQQSRDAVQDATRQATQAAGVAGKTTKQIASDAKAVKIETLRLRASAYKGANGINSLVVSRDRARSEAELLDGYLKAGYNASGKELRAGNSALTAEGVALTSRLKYLTDTAGREATATEPATGLQAEIARRKKALSSAIGTVSPTAPVAVGATAGGRQVPVPPLTFPRPDSGTRTAPPTVLRKAATGLPPAKALPGVSLPGVPMIRFTPTKDAPAKSAPAKATPAKATPAKALPGVSLPGVPIIQFPAAKDAPAKSAPRPAKRSLKKPPKPSVKGANSDRLKSEL